MRELKFRVWDNDQRKFYYFDLKEIPLAVSFGGPVNQFCGLLDKNGKEIYESDIVKSNWQHSGVTCYDYDYIGEVKYLESQACFTMENDQGSHISWYPFDSFEREELSEDGIEIIGNIYENPELLKQTA